MRNVVIHAQGRVDCLHSVLLQTTGQFAHVLLGIQEIHSQIVLKFEVRLIDFVQELFLLKMTIFSFINSQWIRSRSI